MSADGGAGEVSQVVGAIQALEQLADERDFLMVAMVADSKLYSRGTIGALFAAGADFTAPVPAAKTDDGFFAGLDLSRAEVGRTAQREEHLPEAERNMPEKTAARAGVITKTGRVTSCPHTTISSDDSDDSGRPAPTRRRDPEVLPAETAADDWYALITSRPAEHSTPGQARLDQKGQSDAERQVICPALLVFCLDERQVRRALDRDATGRRTGSAPTVRAPGTRVADLPGQRVRTPLTRR